MTTKKKLADIAEEQPKTQDVPKGPQKLRLFGLTKEQVDALLAHFNGQPFGPVEPLVNILRNAPGIDVEVMQKG